jgi:hypothetical protein
MQSESNAEQLDVSIYQVEAVFLVGISPDILRRRRLYPLGWFFISSLTCNEEECPRVQIRRPGASFWRMQTRNGIERKHFGKFGQWRR